MRNIVAGAPILVASAQFGKILSATLTFFDIKFLNNERSKCNFVFCSMLELNYYFLCYLYYFCRLKDDKVILNQIHLCRTFFAECICCQRFCLILWRFLNVYFPLPFVEIQQWCQYNVRWGVCEVYAVFQ